MLITCDSIGIEAPERTATPTKTKQIKLWGQASHSSCQVHLLSRTNYLTKLKNISTEAQVKVWKCEPKVDFDNFPSYSCTWLAYVQHLVNCDKRVDRCCFSHYLATKKGGESGLRKLPPAAIPAAAPKASKSPTARKGFCGRDSISSVTMPAWYRRYRIEK